MIASFRTLKGLINKHMNDILAKLSQKLIVSCQALEDEPLHGSQIMARMAEAACMGGAAGIRANTVQDIRAIRQVTNVPIIGIIKKEYPDSDIYITPTLLEVDALVEEGAEIIAMDATNRPRPGGKRLEEFFREVRQRHPRQLFMADTARFEEGVLAQQLGFDLVGTTLSGYTPETRNRKLPDIALMKKYVRHLSVPIIAEGGISSPQELQQVMNTGVLAAVVGSAITRPMYITRMYTSALDQPADIAGSK